MIFTLLTTILLEGIVVVFYSVLRRKSASALLLASFIVNGFTQAILWIALRVFFRYYLVTLCIAEALIWLSESLLMKQLSNRELTLREALALSLCMNLASFGVGWFLPV